MIMKRRVNIKGIGTLFSLYLILYVLLMLYYRNYISTIFAYEGFYWDQNLEKVIISFWLLFYSAFINYGLKLEKPSFHLLNIMIFISVIPMLVIYSSANLNSYFIFLVIFSLSLIRIIIGLGNFLVLDIVPFTLIKYLVVILALISLAWLIYLNYSYFNLNILKVYEYRLEISSRMPVSLNYMYNLTYKGVIPILYLYFLFTEKKFLRKFLFTLVVFLIYVAIFGLTSHKFFLFVIPIIFILYLISSITRNLSLVFLVIFVLFLMFLYIVNLDQLGFIIKSLFIRRLLFVPAKLNFDYFQFFSQNPYVWFSDSRFLITHYFMSYPYSLDVPHLIGKVIYGRSDMSANTGWIGSGYAHAGVLGMFIYAMIIGTLLGYLDFLAKYLNYKFIVLSFFPYIVTIYLSSDLKTVFLTHGLIFYLLFLNILYIHRKKVMLREILNEKESMSYNNCT